MLLLLSACGGEQKQNAPEVKEDLKAKQLLQGIWLDDDAGDVVFKIHGDTIFYPDTTSMPVAFKVLADTLVLNGAKSSKYPILKQLHNAHQTHQFLKIAYRSISLLEEFLQVPASQSYAS